MLDLATTVLNNLLLYKDFGTNGTYRQKTELKCLSLNTPIETKE